MLSGLIFPRGVTLVRAERKVDSMAIKKVDEKKYEEAILLAVNPVLLNLTSRMNPMCAKLNEFLEEIGSEYGDVVDVMELNVDVSPKFVELFEVTRLPMMVMMTGGVITKKVFGIPEREKFIEEMELDTIREYRQKGVYYHPKRNYIPDYIENQTW